ncbi:hypothetical protein AALP_AA1G226200 [Arabis alpina]|uniref:Vacuolar ATPase assembly protein VMA22 n=1 Tax=Arabis alpina TaxID=50452 RepID=A0A087HPY7_ARAAL|nr:hypothetical protein AALP_AA1G226200 [Arabis alpina]
MARDEEIEICEETEESIDVNNEAELEIGRGDEHVLQFLDSLDGYLTLMDNLNSKLREGWLDLASARHSMGTLRINSTLLDLKDHPAATTLQVTDQEIESLGAVPHFALSKWASKGSRKGKDFSTDVDSEMDSPLSPQIRYRGVSDEKSPAKNETLLAADEEIKKERAKSLSVFGGLVSPKLRGAQLSFETALETLVEIANTRSSMLSAFEQMSKK